MNEKIVVITGASDGIGAAAARLLHRNRPQDRLIIVGRHPEKTAAVARELSAEHHIADFSSQGTLRRLANALADLLRIDVLANTASGMYDGPMHTANGFERTWQINTVAPFLLTSLLRDKHRVGHVVNTASMAAMYGQFRSGGPHYLPAIGPANVPTATPRLSSSCSPATSRPMASRP